MQGERAFDVHWEGPCTLNDLGKYDDDEDAALYAIYSAHPLYGRRVLVYIGMTEKGVVSRLKQHDWWTSVEAEPISVHVAYIGEFSGWKDADAAEAYPRPENEIVKAIEALLIYAHQPAYNQRSKKAALSAAHYRIFNTGLYGALLPEVSGLYFIQSEC